MRISDRYERFNDRVGAGKTGGPSAASAAKTGAQQGAGKLATARASETSVLSVTVSDRAATLAAGSARLDELKDQIAKGTFKIDPKAIAKSLVGDDES